MGLLAILKGEEPDILERLLYGGGTTGSVGEYATEYALADRNVDGYHKLLRNIYLPNGGKTTELDILMLHERGVYVFESKNYSGWIFGSEEQQKWTQSLQGGKKEYFFNPIKQNRTHCRALAAYLGIREEQIASYIVFSSRCELKKVPERTDSYCVLKRDDLLRTLRAELAARPVCWSKEQVDAMYEQLKPLTEVTAAEKQEHVRAIRERMTGDVCPVCGKKLVLRSGQYGRFYGCSGYPKCRYTRKTE